MAFATCCQRQEPYIQTGNCYVLILWNYHPKPVDRTFGKNVIIKVEINFVLDGKIGVRDCVNSAKEKRLFYT